MNHRKRYALVGAGSRAGMFIEAIAGDYAETAELVGLCDVSRIRMAWHNQQMQAKFGMEPLPSCHADDFDAMIRQTKPDAVIVTTVDAWHHHYIIRAMELGCDVISEKPLTTTIDRLKAIDSAIQRTGKSLRVTFNYRYAPAYTQFRKLMMAGILGRPLALDFSWMLDTRHGADYFRRWHREKQHSGGLLAHKACHHFDLVNWWIDSHPKQVFAMGDLLFYGQANAAARGETYSYSRYTGADQAQNDPFALFLDKRPDYKALYLDAEEETGYIRDRNVFGEPITIEDTMTVTARYDNGLLLSYSLIAYAPWEGLRVALTGSKGRIEMDVVENVTHPQAAASKGAFKQTVIRVFPMFGEPYEVDAPRADGGHGGADPIMLEQLFAADPPADPYRRAASHIDGAASILLGMAANLSIESGKQIDIDDLFRLPRA